MNEGSRWRWVVLITVVAAVAAAWVATDGGDLVNPLLAQPMH